MEQDEYRRLHEVEDHMWWFRGMERISLALVERFAAETSELAILDAGCGTGGMLHPLSRFGSVTALDRSAEALRLAKTRNTGALVQASVERLPLAEASFHLVTSFDVLYHLDVRTDTEALVEIARVLRPGGAFLVRVPAHEALRSQHDEAVHTRQRYGKKELTEKLRGAGLEPVFVSYANCLLFPLALLRRGAEKLTGTKREGSEVEDFHPMLNQLLVIPLTIEAWLLRHTSLPFGLSLVAVARKPS